MGRQNQKHSLAHLKETRKILRKHLTTAEATLWLLLKNKQVVNRKFRKQHSIENFIVDFYCASEKLVIELDGNSHDNLGQANADHFRDERLHELGFKVLRLDNDLVMQQPETALELIQSCFTPQR